MHIFAAQTYKSRLFITLMASAENFVLSRVALIELQSKEKSHSSSILLQHEGADPGPGKNQTVSEGCTPFALGPVQRPPERLALLGAVLVHPCSLPCSQSQHRMQCHSQELFVRGEHLEKHV